MKVPICVIITLALFKECFSLFHKKHEDKHHHYHHHICGHSPDTLLKIQKHIEECKLDLKDVIIKNGFQHFLLNEPHHHDAEHDIYGIYDTPLGHDTHHSIPVDIHHHPHKDIHIHDARNSPFDILESSEDHNPHDAHNQHHLNVDHHSNDNHHPHSYPPNLHDIRNPQHISHHSYDSPGAYPSNSHNNHHSHDYPGSHISQDNHHSHNLPSNIPHKSNLHSDHPYEFYNSHQVTPPANHNLPDHSHNSPQFHNDHKPINDGYHHSHYPDENGQGNIHETPHSNYRRNQWTHIKNALQNEELELTSEVYELLDLYNSLQHKNASIPKPDFNLDNIKLLEKHTTENPNSDKIEQMATTPYFPKNNNLWHICANAKGYDPFRPKICDESDAKQQQAKRQTHIYFNPDVDRVDRVDRVDNVDRIFHLKEKIHEKIYEKFFHKDYHHHKDHHHADHHHDHHDHYDHHDHDHHNDHYDHDHHHYHDDQIHTSIITNEDKRIAGCLLHCLYGKNNAINNIGWPTLDGLVHFYSDGVHEHEYFMATLRAVDICLKRASSKYHVDRSKHPELVQSCDLAFDVFDCISDKINEFCSEQFYYHHD